MALGALVVIVLLVVSVVYINSRETSTQSTDRLFVDKEVDTSFYESKPPDPKYPPPAEKQRNFYYIYNAGTVDYELQWSNRNVDRNPLIGPHKFRFILNNSLNKNVTISAEEAKAMTIGCIATENPYKTHQIESEAITLAPYEKKSLDFAIEVECMYLGTADGKYFWRIY